LHVNHVLQPTVLVVDDDCSIRRLIDAIFRGQPFHTLYAASGSIALETCRNYSGPIDLLLTDVNMPGMDGVTLCHFIAKERPEAALLLMSGHAIPENLQDLPFIEKPFKPDVLLLRVRQALRLGKAPQQLLTATA
jgi:two-component system cell cycle sensor histidine kinase/response regulator CckA